jgi:hypothetical protein
MMTMMSSLVGNLASSSLKTSFVDFPTSITPSSTHPELPLRSNSQIYSPVIETALSNYPGI